MKGRGLIYLLCASFLPTTGDAGDGSAAWKREWNRLIEPGEPLGAPILAESEMPVHAVSATSVTPVSVVPDLKPSRHTVTPSEQLREIKKALAEAFAPEGELVILPSRSLEDVSLPNESWRLELTGPLPTVLSSRIALRFGFTNGTETIGGDYVTLQLEWWREAYVASATLRPGGLENPSAYAVQRINWLQYRGRLGGVDTDLSDLQLKSTWRAGEPLQWSQVESKPMGKEGQVLDIIAEEGSLRIAMRGIALQSGNLGEFIAVKNVLSKQEIQGVIRDENTVSVTF